MSTRLSNICSTKPSAGRKFAVGLCLILLSHLPTVVALGDEIQKINELGPVRVTTTLTPAEPTIGDQITLEIRVEFPVDVEVLMPEFGEALNRYTIVDYVPREKIADDGSNLFSQKYTLQPPLSGQQSITPILIEFVDHRVGKKPAPDDADAYEILTDRIDFEVKSVLPSSAANELKPPLGELEPPREMTATSQISWIVGAVIVAIGIVVALLYLKKRRKHVIRRSAYEIARRKLDNLLQTGTPSDEKSIATFFIAISAIVRKYLEDRYELHAPDLTTEEFLELSAKSHQLSNEHRKLLSDFLMQADLVKFAGVRVSETEIERSRDATLRFLEETRENAPLIQDPAESDPTNAALKTPVVEAEKTNV